MDSVFIYDLVILVISLLSLGVVAGFLAGLLGVGGGIVLVPGLYMIFDFLQPRMGFDPSHIMHICVGTSLAVIIPTGLSSVLAHNKRGAVDMDLVRLQAVGIGLGSITASLLAKDIDGHILKMVFATALLFMAGIMILNPARFKISDHMPRQPYPNIAGFAIGCLSGLIGIGGATVSVPYMTLHGVNMHKAVGSASALGLVIAVPAALGYMYIGYGVNNLPPFSIGFVNLLAWGCIIPTSILCAPFGAATAHKVSVKKLKTYFAIFMILVALNMWRKIILG